MTLTVRSNNAPLAVQVTNLYNAFRRLRSKSLWTKNVKGWFVVLEITWNAATDHWHPHLHCVLDAGFLRYQELTKLWLVATRGSRIIDIRRIKDTGRTAGYLTAYLSKANGLTDNTPTHRLAELYETYRRTRLYRAGGTLKTTAKIENAGDDYPSDWTNVYPLLEWLALLDAGSPDAQYIADALRQPVLQFHAPPESQVARCS